MKVTTNLIDPDGRATVPSGVTVTSPGNSPDIEVGEKGGTEDDVG